MKNYSIKIALRGVSPMIWRRLRIPGSTSLADLHHMIQIVFGWDDDHLHRFHIYGKDYGIAYVGGLSFSDNPYAVYLDDFEFDVGDRFTYEYNFFELWLHDIRIEAIETVSTSPSGPFCIKGNGMPSATKYDEVERTMDLVKAIVNSDKSTTVEDILCQIEALDAVRFNRKKVNHRLADMSD
ncbi:MAG: plasmid pRiA4b ORF-3 family protein [Gammaproteobacteria bacterium]|nr:MAG: plasmid pRiA4b ORF-3 family protein [Gammaproteobacteria bacterium]